jgi:hypothetical protein
MKIYVCFCAQKWLDRESYSEEFSAIYKGLWSGNSRVGNPPVSEFLIIYKHWSSGNYRTDSTLPRNFLVVHKGQSSKFERDRFLLFEHMSWFTSLLPVVFDLAFFLHFSAVRCLLKLCSSFLNFPLPQSSLCYIPPFRLLCFRFHSFLLLLSFSFHFSFYILPTYTLFVSVSTLHNLKSFKFSVGIMTITGSKRNHEFGLKYL